MKRIALNDKKYYKHNAHTSIYRLNELKQY